MNSLFNKVTDPTMDAAKEALQMEHYKNPELVTFICTALAIQTCRKRLSGNPILNMKTWVKGSNVDATLIFPCIKKQLLPSMLSSFGC